MARRTGPDGRREAAHTAILYAFDLVERDGEDLRDQPFSIARPRWQACCAIPRQASCLTNILPRVALLFSPTLGVQARPGEAAGGAAEMTRPDEPITPMSLGNMRHHGVRRLDVSCRACGHNTEINVDAWPDDVPVPSFGRHMGCTLCGNLGATAIPNWIERGNSLQGTRRG
jgi:hypothetical protein